MSVLGVGNYVGAEGLDIRALAVLCLLWGMGGSFISLQMSRWIAKRATGVQLVDGRSGRHEADWLYATVERLAQAIRATTGVESLVWLWDVAGLSAAEAQELMCWSAAALLDAARTSPPPVS
jgi:hypothetical protein